MNMRKFAIVIGLAAAAGATALACSGDDDDTVTTNNNPDAGVTTDGAAATYTHAEIKTFVGDVVTDQFLSDAIVGSYFVPNGAGGGADVAPSGATVNDIEECLTYQLGALLGNGDTYSASSPPVVANGGVKGTGYTCRTDMMALHAPLFIAGPVFDKFIADFIAEATKQGVMLPTSAVNTLGGLRSTISSDNPCVPDAGNTYQQVEALCATSGDDAGGDDDASTTPDAGTGIADAATGG